MQQLTIGGRARVLGESNGKLCPGAVTLDFAIPGGPECARACPCHPETTAADPGPTCYAVAMMASPVRRGIAAKLERLSAADPQDVIDAASYELSARGWRVPWFRLSAYGPLPRRVPAGLRRMLERLVAAGSPVHMPVEGARKANRYRAALAGVGVAVRESVTSRRRWRLAPGACSIVAGSMADPPRQRLSDAKRAARVRQEATGRRCIVCPAVAESILYRKRRAKRSKCGRCVACAKPCTDVVYPAHA